jgi:hypothetical protein
MLQILNAARKAGLRVFYALHHRYRPGDYETWKYIAPVQKAAWSRKSFEYATWGGEIRREFEPQPGDIVGPRALGLQWFRQHRFGTVHSSRFGGVEVSEVFHGAEARVPGPDPQGRSYASYASWKS